VGRIPDGAAEKELQEYFSQFGELTDVYIPKPNRNFGFVTFASGEIAKSVVSQNHRLHDSLLNVSFAEPKANSMRGAAAASGYPMGLGMGYDMWYSGNRQGGGGGYNAANAASAYNMMNMMSQAGMPGMMGSGTTNKTWSRGTNPGMARK
jgi:RNA recognition motif-containing protein